MTRAARSRPSSRSTAGSVEGIELDQANDNFRFRSGLFKVMIGLMSAASVWAQTSLVNSALEGSVGDSSGGRTPGVTIMLREAATHQTREAATTGERMFRFSELPPGTHEVSVLQAGFTPYKHTGVLMPLGSTVHLDIILQSENVTTQVTVTAQPPKIDPAQTSVSSAVDKERNEGLPVESRNYLNFALLAPGVASSAQQPGKQSLASLPTAGSRSVAYWAQQQYHH